MNAGSFPKTAVGNAVIEPRALSDENQPIKELQLMQLMQYQVRVTQVPHSFVETSSRFASEKKASNLCHGSVPKPRNGDLRTVRCCRFDAYIKCLAHYWWQRWTGRYLRPQIPHRASDHPLDEPCENWLSPLARPKVDSFWTNFPSRVVKSGTVTAQCFLVFILGSSDIPFCLRFCYCSSC